MALGNEVGEFLSGIDLFDMTLNQFIIKIIFAVLLIVVGIILGKIIGKAVKKLLGEIKVKEKAGGSFFNLIVWVIELAVYILFINFALTQFNIPALTSWLTSILIIIPAFVGALILIGFGFVVAVYLRSIVEDSQVVGWRILSLILFYFVIFISMVYALKTALISVNKQVTNSMIVILTAVVGAWIAYHHITNKEEHKEIKKK